MKTKVIEFTVTKIGQTSNDKLFAVLSSDKPKAQLGGLTIAGRAMVYRIELDNLPDGVELKEVGKNGKNFTREVKMDKIPLTFQQVTNIRPFEPKDFRVEEREVEGDDGVLRTYKWLVKEEL